MQVLSETKKLEMQSDEIFIEINNLLLGKVDNDLRKKVLSKVTEIVTTNVRIISLKTCELIKGS